MDQSKNEEQWKKMLPGDIEKLSFSIISKELGDKQLPLDQSPIIKRVIHTSADFEYAENMYFSKNAINRAMTALKNGVTIVSDTRMVQAGINKRALNLLGCKVECLMDDEQVAQMAKQNNTTRAVAAMHKASGKWKDAIYVVGNAPTALLTLCDLWKEKKIDPPIVVGVPVGFVNVVESKECVIHSGIECIVARGRKGGSNIAAAICNALMYEALGEHR